MTDKLYQTDSYLQQFEAVILEQREIDGRPAVRLDRTVFYPTSGGQMHDRGLLGATTVENVLLVDGEIWHLLAAPATAGDRVSGQLDWRRRFDFMQQHTAFHILAGAFIHDLQCKTLSSHLGEDFCTIDVQKNELDDAELDRIERTANQVVWDNRAVTVSCKSAEEQVGLPVRKESKRMDSIRLVEIAGWDLDPCGGTHVAATGQVGIIKIWSKERIRGSLRLTFSAGGRCLDHLQNHLKVLFHLGRQLSTGVSDLPAAVDKHLTELQQERKLVQNLRLCLLDTMKEQILLEARGKRVVARLLTDLDMGSLRTLASQLIRESDAVFLLASESDRLSMIFATCRAGVDLNPVFQQMASQLGAKGGGKPDFVQGSAPKTGEKAASVLQEAAIQLQKQLFST